MTATPHNRLSSPTSCRRMHCCRAATTSSKISLPSSSPSHESQIFAESSSAGPSPLRSRLRRPVSGLGRFIPRHGRSTTDMGHLDADDPTSPDALLHIHRPIRQVSCTRARVVSASVSYLVSLLVMPPPIFILSCYAVLALAIAYRAREERLRNVAESPRLIKSKKPRSLQQQAVLRAQASRSPYSWLNAARARPLLVVSFDVLFGTVDRWATVSVRLHLEYFLSTLGDQFDVAIWMPSSNIKRLDEILRQGGQAGRLSDHIVLAIDQSSVATIEGHVRYECAQQAVKPLAVIWRQRQQWNASNTILCVNRLDRGLTHAASITISNVRFSTYSIYRRALRLNLKRKIMAIKRKTTAISRISPISSSRSQRRQISAMSSYCVTAGPWPNRRTTPRPTRSTSQRSVNGVEGHEHSNAGR